MAIMFLHVQHKTSLYTLTSENIFSENAKARSATMGPKLT
uniref:Uncharacterized protein n=1 Tax=Anguilla anguilla TaxID=7936 RepID=A0A0E9XZU5_ANGAN